MAEGPDVGVSLQLRLEQADAAMKGVLSTVVVLTCCLAVAGASPVAMPGGPAEVDLTPAIKIGDFATSRYLFEKAYRQFLGSRSTRTGEEGLQRKAERWLRLFLAREVIKADLVEQGQLARPEVLEVTEQMAQYILTQPKGPLYSELGGSNPVAFRRERRILVLKESQFSAYPENIARLWNAIAPSLSRRVSPCEAAVKPIAGLILAEYFFDGEAQRISALDFVRDFRRGIARIAPRDPESLEGQIADMVVTKYDLAEAIRLGLDRTPQFLEDRHNFALNHVFAIYEQEVLSKQVGIADVEMQAEYRTDAQCYISPREISGTLFVYLNPTTARRGALASSDGDGAERGAPILIKRDAPNPLPGIPYALLSSMPIGRKLGPFPYFGKYAVFLKKGAGQFEPLPFPQVEPEIQRTLMRKKLDRLELEYLARNAGRVQVLVDLANYGLRPVGQ